MRFLKKSPIRPSELVLIGDQVMILFGLITALFANYRILSIKIFPVTTIFYRLLIHLCLAITAWAIFKIYKKVIRFFNSNDYLNLITSVFLIHVASIAIGFVLPAKLYLRTDIFIISFFITSIYMVGSRLIISYLYSHYRQSKKGSSQNRLLIYGAGELGVILKKSINNYPDFKLFGFLDDDKNKIGRKIEGIPVIDADKGLKECIVKNGITDIIIANKLLNPARKAKFLEDTIMFNVRIREIPSIQSILNSDFNLNKLTSLDINDLMNREPIELYDKHVEESLVGKTILVTGAAGSIGSEIVRKLSEHNASLIVCLDFSESALYDLQQELKRKYPEGEYRFMLADIKDEEIIHNLFEEYSPHIVYHAAAYKHVPLMEEFPWQAVQTNVLATWQIVKLAVLFKAEKFVFISSDKAVNPTSLMGATKRLAEIIVQSFSSRLTATRFVITRFGNVLGSNGSVVPLFKKQIQEGGPVTVTHPDMTRYFMTISEACLLVLEASAMAEGGEVFVFDMGKPVKIVDMARNMIRLAGYIPDVDMQIQFVGQRPGEKLYEDLFLDNEEMKETHHEKIMISKESSHDISEAEQIISKLQSLSNIYDPELYKIVIKDLLPNYLSTMIESKVINITSGKKFSEYNYQN